CDVITYEFENVDVAAVQSLESRLPCYPPSSALATSQDRLVEKQFFNNLGIATAPFRDVENHEQIEQALAELGGRAILKTRRFGYDGKGQLRLDASASDSIDEALDEASGMASKTPCILEGFVNFKREISIIAARGQDGAVACFDIVENVHRNGILFTSTVPANSDAGIIRHAHKIAEKVLPALEYVGVLAIEFFETDDGKLLVNEFAPRVHNSGHWTEAACTISQFEQHIRAVAGVLLGNTGRHSNCVMENLIGDEILRAPEILKMENTLLHLYGKSETREGRKMGHFTTIKPLQD
ncbi:MAG: 5-(carboxyamino)imidazole ribonucleotide synthase, partial [Pseudomonadota bacterium]